MIKQNIVQQILALTGMVGVMDHDMRGRGGSSMLKLFAKTEGNSQPLLWDEEDSFMNVIMEHEHFRVYLADDGYGRQQYNVCYIVKGQCRGQMLIKRDTVGERIRVFYSNSRQNTIFDQNPENWSPTDFRAWVGARKMMIKDEV